MQERKRSHCLTNNRAYFLITQFLLNSLNLYVTLTLQDKANSNLLDFIA